MYKYYNNNKFGLFEDDCTVRAISLAENKTWDQTYNKLSDLAQARGTMMDNKEFIIDYLDSRYKRIDTGSKLVGEISGEYKNYILLITMKGHITCSYFGVVMDSYDCRNKISEFAWIIEKRR